MRYERYGRWLLVLAWVVFIGLCIWKRDEITVESILYSAPERPALAVLAVLGLFALKSLSIIVYSGILYAAVGILFPLPVAIGVNILGTVIMLSLPYWLGRRSGPQAVRRIKAKYPRVEIIHKLRPGSDFFFSFLIRVVNLLPYDIVSLYMGAIRVEYRKYILGGVLGTLPSIIAFPVMGMNITNIHSPQFLVSMGVEIAFMAAGVVGYVIMNKKEQRKNNLPPKEKGTGYEP